MMICAPLAKSPNCASHSTSVSGIGHAVAEFEAHHSEFAQQAVDGLEFRRVWQVFQRKIALAGFSIVELQMALREGAAGAILAAQPHRRTIHNQAAERNGFSKAPVDRITVQTPRACDSAEPSI